MAGEIQLNGTTALTESGGVVTLNNVDSATNRTNLGLGTAATSASTDFVGASRTITAGTGLSGGGDLSANRTINVSFSANESNVKTAINASGSAPIYACRAWVNFNGTGTVAIRDSGNVSSITDHGGAGGDYTVNFATAMPDANYSTVGTTGYAGNGTSSGFLGANRNGSTGNEEAPTTTAVRVNSVNASGNSLDTKHINVSIFR
jgi:hypothetical protein